MPSQGTADLAQGSSADAPFAIQFPLQILIADDDYMTRRILSILLQKLGYQIDSVENGLQCLKAAQKKSYDLIFSDINMPEMTGIECAACLRESGIEATIVAITANSDPDVRAQCFEAGINEYLSKPMNVETIKKTLRETFAARNRG